MQEAIAGSNEGARDFEALKKKFEPRRTELQNLNTEVENLKKQLNTQGDKMNEEARATLVKSIETKQKSLQRSAEDAQNEYQAQLNEIAQRILQKMAPVIDKYVQANGYGLLLDSSNQWPQGPLLWPRPRWTLPKRLLTPITLSRALLAPAAKASRRPPQPNRPARLQLRPSRQPRPAATKPANKPQRSLLRASIAEAAT